MRTMFRVLTVTGLAAVAAVSLDAQPRRPVRPLPAEARERQLDVRERMLERREAIVERREGRGPGWGVERRMMIRRGMMRERIANLNPEQREALREHRELAGAERAKVREEVRAGRLNREQARTRLQKWREEHKPPVDLRRPVRPNGE